MPIRVTCPGCHVRFNVSEKFAGREGPCPKCKVVIRIPDKTEEVVVHAPETSGPTDTKGRPVLKPIARKETELSGVQITLIVGIILVFFVGALAFRIAMPDVTPNLAEICGWVLAGLLAAPCAFAGYSFLRDQERGAFLGKELWLRIAVVSLLYLATWGSMWLSYYAFNNSWGGSTWFSAATAMLLIGGGIGMATLDFEYLTGVLHYGMYFGICLLARMVAGIGLFPGTLSSTPALETKTPQLTAFLSAWDGSLWWLG